MFGVLWLSVKKIKLANVHVFCLFVELYAFGNCMFGDYTQCLFLCLTQHKRTSSQQKGPSLSKTSLTLVFPDGGGVFIT